MPSRKSPSPESEPLLISPDRLRELPLPTYATSSDKAARGKLLIVAGSRRLPGAAVLASRAAFRVGVGNVRLATVESIATHIGILMPELMVVPLPETPAGTLSLSALPLVEQQYASCHAVVVGPGLDESPETEQVSRQIVERSPLPTLVDAHAILSLPTGEPVRGAGPRVFTPHLKEMAALSGQDEDAIERDKQRVGGDFVRRSGATLVLKGRETLIASPEGALYVNTAGSRALGTAGSGDTLAGVIGGLLAQRMAPEHAAVWGVYLHALAGEEVAREYGEDGGMASDFVERLPIVLRYLRSRTL
jgi:ADP-dependent NAD(P)H-hydrate dehydratase